MLNRTILAGLTLLFAGAGATAQDNPAPAPDAPHMLRMRASPRGALQLAPRMREAGPRLGVTVESTADGLKVTGVDDGSLATSAGVLADDVLLRIGDRRVHVIEDVALALHSHAPGDKIEVTVVRPGQGLITLEGLLPAPKAPEKQKLPAADGVKGGFLGVQMKADGADGGVAVAGVVPDSAAWFAGLDEGDVLLSLDGKALASPEDLAGAVAGKEPGAMVELKYRRNGDEQSARVRLGHRSPVGFLGGLGAPGSALGQRPRVFRVTPDGGVSAFGDHDFAMPDIQFPDMDAIFGGDFPFAGMDDMDGAFGDLHGAQSVEIRIDNDHMTITKDGVTQEYERNADGQWTRQENKTPAEATPHGA